MVQNMPGRAATMDTRTVSLLGVGDIPNNSNLTVGSQFTMGTQNNTINDTYCAGLVPPRLTVQAHMAPLDIVFNNSGTEAGSPSKELVGGHQF
jgi:hypothetical protein